MNIYILFLAAFLLAAGSFGDRFGRKKVLFIGLILFGITSIMAGFSARTEMLIIARAFMGLAAAIMLPLTISILPTIFPTNERGKAISIWAAGMGVGLLIGPLIGGFLLEHFAWGSIFFINLPIIVTTIAGVIFFVPESKDPNAHKMDWIGMFLSSMGLMLLIYGLTEGPKNGWLSFELLAPTIIGFVVIMIFVFHQKKSKHPMLDLNIFRNARFTWATVAGTILMFILAGVLFFVTQYMDFFFNTTPLEAGIKLMPLIGAYVVGAIFSDKIAKKIGTKWVVTIGLFVLAIGLFLFTTLDATSTYGNLVWCFIIQGVGMGLVLAPSMDAVMEALPIADVGVGSAVNNALRQVGSTIGIAVMGSVISYRYEKGLTAKMSSMPSDLLYHAKQSIGAAKHIALKLETPIREQLLLNAGNAFFDGVQIALFIGIIFIVIAIITTILFLPSQANNDNK